MDGDIVRHMVHHLNHNPISLSGDDARAGKLTVDRHDTLGVAQPGDIFHCYLKAQSILYIVNKKQAQGTICKIYTAQIPCVYV